VWGLKDPSFPYFSILQWDSVCPYTVRIRIEKHLYWSSITESHYCDHCVFLSWESNTVSGIWKTQLVRNTSSPFNDDIRGMSRLNQQSCNSCTRRLSHTSIARRANSSIYGWPTFQNRDTLESEITFLGFALWEWSRPVRPRQWQLLVGKYTESLRRLM